MCVSTRRRLLFAMGMVYLLLLAGLVSPTSVLGDERDSLPEADDEAPVPDEFAIPTDYLPDEEDLPSGVTMILEMPRTLVGDRSSSVLHRYYIADLLNSDGPPVMVDLIVTLADSPGQAATMWQTLENMWLRLGHVREPVETPLGEITVITRQRTAVLRGASVPTEMHFRVGTVLVSLFWEETPGRSLLDQVLPLARVVETYAWANPSPRVAPSTLLVRLPSAHAEDGSSGARNRGATTILGGSALGCGSRGGPDGPRLPSGRCPSWADPTLGVANTPTHTGGGSSIGCGSRGGPGGPRLSNGRCPSWRDVDRGRGSGRTSPRPRR